jgi:hypothetical protein
MLKRLSGSADDTNLAGDTLDGLRVKAKTLQDATQAQHLGLNSSLGVGPELPSAALRHGDRACSCQHSAAVLVL